MGPGLFSLFLELDERGHLVVCSMNELVLAVSVSVWG